MDSGEWCLLASGSSSFSRSTNLDVRLRRKYSGQGTIIYPDIIQPCSKFYLEVGPGETSDRGEWKRASMMIISNWFKTEERPIIFVAHSLGGIVLKYVSLQKAVYLSSIYTR